ncbi:MAG: hypothetical protein PHQ96_05870 [Candidatus Omnitrophica bacterium]|nr:hypothetical protein [Candidatus Omnitrophota bacterium]
MRAFGYQINKEDLLELSEATFEGTPEEIKTIGEFLIKVSETMKQDNFGHEHLRDNVKDWKEKTDVVVIKQK